MNKTHYRKVFKSDHLGIADLEDFIEEGKPLIFTIKEVKQEIGVRVAGKKGNFNIAYFIEKIKPLVLNATNSKVVKSFNKKSPFVEDWANTPVELFIDEGVKMKGEIVGGVRVRQVQPDVDKPKRAFTKANFKAAFEKLATVEMIQEIYFLSDEVKIKYLEYVSENGGLA